MSYFCNGDMFCKKSNMYINTLYTIQKVICSLPIIARRGRTMTALASSWRISVKLYVALLAGSMILNGGMLKSGRPGTICPT